MIAEIGKPKTAFDKIGAMKLQKRHIQMEWNEGHPDHGGDGYWIMLRAGWKSDDDPVGVLHTIHENTRRDCFNRVGVLPCDCEECEQMLAKATSIQAILGTSTGNGREGV